MLFWIKSVKCVNAQKKHRLNHAVVQKRVSDMLQSLIGPVTGILDKFIEDKDQKAKLAHEIATIGQKHAQEIALSQIEVNKAEAA